MKKHILPFLFFISTITFISSAHSQDLTLEALDKRIKALETAQEKAKPDIAWVVNAMETMFSLAFYNYTPWIKTNSERYLSESGKAAYEKIINDLNVISEIKDTQQVLTARIKDAPINRGYFIKYATPPNKASTEYTYYIVMNLSYQSGNKVKNLGDYKFQVTVDTKHKGNAPEYTLVSEKEFKITDIIPIEKEPPMVKN